MLCLVLGDKTGKSNTSSAGANNIAMPAGRGKLCSPERGAPSSAERLPCTRGPGEAPAVGSPNPEKVEWEAEVSLLSDTSQTGFWEKTISPSISGDTKRPGGCA